MELTEKNPELFREGDFEIIFDEEIVDEFCRKNDRVIGQIYHSPYHRLLVDLVKMKKKGKYIVAAYERMVPMQTGAGVAVLVSKGKFLLLKQFRHAVRKIELGFPRGFGEADLESTDNIGKELKEECGIETGKIKKKIKIGKIAQDTGILGTEVDVYYCEADDVKPSLNYEGILGYTLLEENELTEKIRSGEITDGFTLSSFLLYKEWKDCEKGKGGS